MTRSKSLLSVIFSTIGEVATEIDANLVIMGTHGIRGMQKLTGSWALKVIVGSKAPFLVVQGPPESDQLHDIVFPFYLIAGIIFIGAGWFLRK